MGSVVSFQRKGSTKTEMVCLCGRDDLGSHELRHDCKPVSLSAPLGKALFGKSTGTRAVVESECGKIYELTITQIELKQPAANAA